MVTQQAVEEELSQYLKDHILARGVVFRADSLVSQIGVDSFSLLEIVMFIERKYSISLPEEALTVEKLESVRTIAATVMEFLGNANSASL